MECAINRKRRIANIRISNSAWFIEDDAEFEQLIKHELIHVLFDEILAEHDLQLAALQTDRVDEYKIRMINEVEKAVEHLAQVLYSK